MSKDAYIVKVVCRSQKLDEHFVKCMHCTTVGFSNLFFVTLW